MAELTPSQQIFYDFIAVEYGPGCCLNRMAKGFEERLAESGFVILRIDDETIEAASKEYAGEAWHWISADDELKSKLADRTRRALTAATEPTPGGRDG